jgi:hypothetical protein
MRILIVLLSSVLTFGCMRAPALDEAEAVAVTRAARELLDRSKRVERGDLFST